MTWNKPLPRGHRETAHAEALLRERLNAGAIDETEFQHRLAVLRGQPNRRRWRVIVMATAGGVTLAAAAGGLAYAAQNMVGQALSGSSATSCSAPQLSGQVVDVTVSDMNMMRGGVMSGYGMFSVTVSPAQVHAGTLSLRVSNIGVLTHELVVLPLGNRAVGGRSVGADGRVDESGSLGEASATCAAGAREGIASGTAGWVTLQLAAGRYELICNLPGHYAVGMHAELDVTA
jgi:uncharacterized cupredoxin-like copper-binding protein